MLKNYLKVTIRNLVKNKIYVSINVIGLSLALACCIVAYLNTKFDMDFDQNHENIEKIFMVQSNKEVQGRNIPYGFTPLALGPAIQNDVAGTKVVRYQHNRLSIKDKQNDKILRQLIGFADPDLLDVLTFPVIKGSKESFKQKGNILISEETAVAYFGDEDPIGRVLTVFNDDGKGFNYIVSAVMQDSPENTTFQFDALLPFENYLDVSGLEDNNWRRFIGATLLYLDNPESASNIEGLLSKYVPVQNKARDDWKIAQFYLAPMTIIGDTGREMRGYWFFESLHPAAVVAPPIMALLILLIACFNFTNTSIATSSKRLKEIGVRKVIGGSRRQLIIQFMSENIFICVIAILLSIVVAAYLVPAYSAMWEGMTLELNFVENYGMYLFLFGLLIFTAILAGAYPSLYVSRFEPVTILRGSTKIGGTSGLSKVLLTLQYAFTVLALFASIAFTQNATYQKELDLGYNREDVIGVQVENETEYKKMKAVFERNPNFISTAGTSEHIGRWEYSRTLKNADREVETNMMDFGPNYIATMDLKVLQGRGFTEDLLLSDKEQSIIVNEALVKEFKWEEPIGKRVAIDDTTKLTVIGVVADFYKDGFWNPIEPVGIRIETEDAYNFVVGKVSSDKLIDTYKAIEEEWAQEIPTRPYAGFYQDDLNKEAKTVNNNIVIIFSFLGLMAVVLSGIGLFTLVSLNVIKRIKEIGVRKVLGGSINHIIGLLNKDFIVLLVIASVLGVVGGYFLIDALIASIFAHYKSVDTLTFMLPVAIILICSLSISSFRILNAARRNPVESLRYE